MTADGRRVAVSSHRRFLLQAGWELCRIAPEAPWPGDEADWLCTGAPATAAAAWRAAGRWRLDGEPLRFDRDDWCWRVRVDAPEALVPDGTWMLGFDGLATLAEVRFNGVPVLASANMFMRQEIDLSRLLRARDNLIEIRCRALDAALAVKRPRPRWRAPLVEHAQLRWIRTSLLGRTPGWSPPAPAVGPVGQVWLERRTGVSIRDVSLQARCVGAGGELAVALALGGHDGPRIAAASLVCERGGRAATLALAPDPDGCVRGALQLAQVDLWWPHTHGEPALYRVHLDVMLDGVAAPVRVDLGQVGFRTLAVDRRGDGFAVHVNGVRIFCRGACWTPLDPVSLHDDPADLRAAVLGARDAGMNMLRVTGPTVYGQDAFYDACDAAGVLVWQDFMFANMDYPAEDADFAAQVDAEVVQQLQRLGGHACLAVFCGNSEQEQQAAMWGVARELVTPPLFHQRIPALCARHAPGVPYWPSSAHGGSFPFRPDAGTCSYYGVGAYLEPLDDALGSRVRFATECLAFANVPPASTLARARHDEGEHPYQSRFRAAERDFHAVRDHYFEQLTGRSAEAARAEDAERFLALSRWVSGHVMSETFVRWRSTLSPCGGGMVWFLRDLQAGAGWGLLDDQGVPKAAWHIVRRVLQPVMVALLDKRMNGVDVELANDGPQPLEATLEVQGWLAGGARIVQAQRPVRLAPRSTQALALADELGVFMDLGHAYRFGPPPCDLLRARLLDRDGGVIAEGTLLPQGLRAPLQADIGLTAQLQRADPRDAAGGWRVRVSATACAVGVHLESATHRPADDYVMLAPGDDRTIGLLPLDAGLAEVVPTVRVAALNTLQACVVTGGA